jgi:hypothetical protein
MGALAFEKSHLIRNCSLGAKAGLAGGAAEVIWIALYGKLSPISGLAVAEGVTATFSPSIALTPVGAAAGVIIHMGIAVVLGMAIALAFRAFMPAHRPAHLTFLMVVGLLTGIWAVNFIVLLPLINAAFASLIPYWASLASKVLFGIAAATILLVTPRAS